MNFRIPLLLSFACFGVSAHAANIYQCKGKNGETAFSNVPCDGKATAKVHSTYEPVRDDPPQAVATDDVAARGAQDAPSWPPGPALAQSAPQAYEPQPSSTSG